ncbi:hypothetical protein [Methylobacterium sp. J-067]|uniref:hypothetical protein n=1 Tax=Methylobacterium sp. J-067 TaxID=2836648 RepID=UPI001FBAFE59|nr:hypothetical protein [Methylobacterium sp. J-067]MCJ2026451.1 hypothetical protein [Methylobacterium sp. J-067]
MREDADHRLAMILADLMRLSRQLPPEDFADLLGAVSVEVETGMELVTERNLRRREGNVIGFPGRTSHGHAPRTPVG